MKSYAEILAGRDKPVRRRPKARAKEGRQVPVLHEVQEKRAKKAPCGCAEKKRRRVPPKNARFDRAMARRRAAFKRRPRDKKTGRFLTARQIAARRRTRRNPLVASFLTATASGVAANHVSNHLKNRSDKKKQEEAKKRRQLAKAERAKRAQAKEAPRRNPLAVRPGYRKRAALQRDLTRHYEECSASTSARRYRGERRKAYCAGVAWKIIHNSNRYNDYFSEENPAMARKRRQTAAQRRASLRNLAKARRARGGGRRRRRAAREVVAANPIRSRRRHMRRRYAREKLPGGRIRVRRTRVHIRQRNVPTRSYIRHYAGSGYSRGPYTYRPGHPKRRRRAPVAHVFRYRGRLYGARPGYTRPERRALRHNYRLQSGAMENPIMAYENPLSGGEMVVIAITGVLGYGLGSFLDRLLATHAITDTSTKSTGGIEIFTDAPAAGQTYNTEAVLAPMGLTRWALGLGAPLVLGFGSRFIGGPWLKTVLQGAAVGWGVRTLGMGWDNAMASLFKSSQIGQRYYAQELMAQNAAKAVAAVGATALASQSTQTEIGFSGVPQARMLAGSCRGCGTACGGSCGCGGCTSGCNCNNGMPDNPQSWQPPAGGSSPGGTVVYAAPPPYAYSPGPTNTSVLPMSPIVTPVNPLNGQPVGAAGRPRARFSRLAGVPERRSPRTLNPA